MAKLGLVGLLAVLIALFGVAAVLLAFADLYGGEWATVAGHFAAVFTAVGLGALIIGLVKEYRG